MRYLQRTELLFRCTCLFLPGMKKAWIYIKENKAFLLFLFIFSWIFTLKNKIGLSNSWDNFVFHPDTPYWVFLQALLIFLFVDSVRRKADHNSLQTPPTPWRYLAFFGVSFICYLIVVNLFGLLVTISFDNLSRNYNSSHQITYRLFQQVIDFFIFGGISLAYLYSKDNKNFKTRLNDYAVANAKAKIHQLRTQLDPHFLFNNLNILDQLIEEDQEKASIFLSQFAELYRYALSSSDKELVDLNEELSFAQNYFNLMEKKYSGYYQLTVDDTIHKVQALLPPLCLQILIENAVFHNLGTSENPVQIKISTDHGIKISNNKVVPARKKKTNGIGLKNLNQQFELLTNTSLKIEESEDTFTVTLPFIRLSKNA